MILIVKEPFKGYSKGDKITDPDRITVILESDNSGHVIKSAREE
jgi:hypothetical protein